jgi:hypothetical protein
VQDKELRNEVLVISSFLARAVECQPHFAESGYLGLLLLYSTASEAGTQLTSSHAAIKPFNLTTAEEDIEMKRLMLGMIGALATHPDCLASIEPTHFLGTLLRYLGRGSQQPGVPFLDKISAESVRDYQRQVAVAARCWLCGATQCDATQCDAAQCEATQYDAM